jgi:ABC-2 type transport system permease protein
VPADVLTAPFEVQATNTVRAQPSVIAFYAPAVVALLLQHIAISLVSLSMVRERLLGAMEIYRVAPVGTRDLIVGKSWSYALLLGLLAALLIFVIVRFIHVPLLGPVGGVVAVLGLLLFASLGIGFLLATFAQSEMQAVQLAMLVFLGSTIFGDFFLPIEQLWPPVRVVSYLFPVTFATMGLRDVMLRGVAPSLVALAGPLLLGLVSYGLAARSIRREMATA